MGRPDAPSGARRNHGGEPVLVLDGAMGTELSRRGHDTSLPLWSTLPMLEAPDVVMAIHRAYLEAGAEIITANTFRTNPRAFAAAGRTHEEARRATHLAVSCARRAVDGWGGERAVRIAGSMAPVEDCYRWDLVPATEPLELEHATLAGWLIEAGVDLILVETMGTIREAEVAVTAAARAGRQTRTPVWASFICGPRPDRLISGEPLARAVRVAEAAGAEALGVNCVPAESMAASLDIVGAASDRPIIGYANGGRVEPDGRWRYDPDLTPERFAELGEIWLRSGARIVGGCCGTGPEHVRALRRAVDIRYAQA